MRALHIVVSATLISLLACSDSADGGEDTPPAAPVVTAPAPGAVVLSPLAVTGTAEADGVVACSVLSDTTVIGTANANADASGAWSATVTFTEQARGAALTVRVTQTVGSLTSAATDVAVVQGGVPDPPTLVSPAVGAAIATPVTVQGTGVAGLEVTATVLDGAAAIGSESGTVDATGAFDLSVAYTAPAVGTSLTVSVVQTNASGASDPATVSVTHQPRTLSGSVSQSGGSTAGTAVYVRLYNSATEVVDFIDEETLSAADGVMLPGTAFSFDVGDGRYYVRAYRDGSGPHDAAPDGHPTLPSDAQAAAIEATVAGSDVSGVDLTLDDPGAVATYRGFNAYTSNESGEQEPPGYWDPNLMDWVEGLGLCRGFNMRLVAFSEGTATGLSAPMVARPGGDRVTLLDDGGCGEAADNTASSYDEGQGDGAFSYGWNAPTAADAGEYVLFYRETQKDLIHSMADSVGSTAKLNRRLPLSAPTGAAAAGTTPTLDWDDVSGAAVYKVFVRSEDNSPDIFSAFLTQSEWTISTPLDDISSYDVSIEVFDANPEAGDFDARSFSTSSHFLVDSAGTNTVTISGDIVNDTGESGAFHLTSMNGQRRAVASLVLPAGSTSYAIKNLRRGPSEDKGFLVVLMDVDGTGDSTAANKAYQQGVELDHSADVTHDLVLAAPLVALSPVDGATGVGDTPTVTWQDYSAHAPAGPWIYGVFFQADSTEGDFPDAVWGLPNTATSFDMASKPAALLDVIWGMNCNGEGGEVAPDGSCSGASATPPGSPADLSADTLWQWGVVVLECDWAQKGMDANTNAQDDLWECVAMALSGQGIYAQSQEGRTFSTQ